MYIVVGMMEVVIMAVAMVGVMNGVVIMIGIAPPDT